VSDPKNSDLEQSGPETSPGDGRKRVSRRGFIQGAGVASALVPGLLQARTADAAAAPVQGPAAIPVTLTINGKAMKLTIEPRVTLLDALRNHLDLTGAKRVCDRGTCGACTVLLNDKVVYSCSVLAIDAQGKKITTIEGFADQNGKPHPVVQAFVNNDAQQCGYCTPGFVVAVKGFLDHHPNPTYEEVKDGLGGNLCRCGTYVGVRKAALEAAKAMKPATAAKKEVAHA
jgi:xanthine dehydrogenase YagT iron-sulfur-binding subunit